jgi:hypothetical protein
LLVRLFQQATICSWSAVPMNDARRQRDEDLSRRNPVDSPEKCRSGAQNRLSPLTDGLSIK